MPAEETSARAKLSKLKRGRPAKRQAKAEASPPRFGGRYWSSRKASSKKASSLSGLFQGFYGEMAQTPIGACFSGRRMQTPHLPVATSSALEMDSSHRSPPPMRAGLTCQATCFPLPGRSPVEDCRFNLNRPSRPSLWPMVLGSRAASPSVRCINSKPRFPIQPACRFWAPA